MTICREKDVLNLDLMTDFVKFWWKRRIFEIPGENRREEQESFWEAASDDVDDLLAIHLVADRPEANRHPFDWTQTWKRRQIQPQTVHREFCQLWKSEL